MTGRRVVELTPGLIAGAVLFLLAYGVGMLAFARWWYAPQAPSAQIAQTPRFAAVTTRRVGGEPSSQPGQDAGSAPVIPSEATGSRSPGAADARSLRNRAEDAYAAGEYATATRYYEQALAQSPADVNLSNNLGLVLHYLGRTAEAMALLEQVATNHPSHQRVWLTYGFVLANAGHADRAREALLRARDLDPESAIGAEATRMLEPLWRG